MSKEFKNIDDLFRDRFESFEPEPPGHVWDNIKSHIQENPAKGGFGLKGGGIAGLSAILITAGLISFYLISNSFSYNNEPAESTDKQIIANTSELFADNSIPTPSIELVINENRQVAENSQIIETTQESIETPTIPEQTIGNNKSGIVPDDDSKKRKKNKTSGKNKKAQKNSSIILAPEFNEEIDKAKIARQGMTVAPVAAPEFTIDNEVVSIEPKNTDHIVSPEPQAETVSNTLENVEPVAPEIMRGQGIESPNASSQEGVRSDYGKPGSWVFGAYFTPEMIIYSSDDLLKNYSYSADLHATYKVNNLFLQSGFGLSRNQDKGNSHIEYNEFLGTYEDLVNITFDSTQNGVIATYHTETVEVYDTINHTVINPSKRFYTYLQIPMFIGYGEESRRIGWFVKGGPSLSVLLHEQIPETGLDPEQARILNIENDLPGRIKTNWQFILSAGATYKLGEKVSLSVEPMFRYYIRSAYEQGKLNTKHPYSVGLRTGFLLNF